MTIERSAGREVEGPDDVGIARGSAWRALKALGIIAALIGWAGCGDDDEPPGLTKAAVKFEEVPENVRAAATKAVPGIPFKEAWKNLGAGGKLHSYEIRGKNPADGKTREVRISPGGEVLEME